MTAVAGGNLWSPAPQPNDDDDDELVQHLNNNTGKPLIQMRW